MVGAGFRQKPAPTINRRRFLLGRATRTLPPPAGSAKIDAPGPDSVVRVFQRPEEAGPPTDAGPGAQIERGTPHIFPPIRRNPQNRLKSSFRNADHSRAYHPNRASGAARRHVTPPLRRRSRGRYVREAFVASQAVVPSAD